MVAPGDLLAGRYRIDAPLGAGGMATVHRAHDLLLARDVAVKILAQNLATMPARLERFGREARAMAAVSHPNIVAVYDVGWSGDEGRPEPFLVMELVAGGTLAGSLAANGPLDPAAVVTLVDGLADALAALHRAGIVHRDVKPQNVLLSGAGPKLADLGVIRLDDTDELAALTASGEMPGTLRYLAPEVLFGQPAGPMADAFGLAMVAFEALTGRSPRPAVTLGELVDSAWQPPPLVSQARPGLGTGFDAAFTAALDLDPNRRLDALGFAAALHEAAPSLDRPTAAAAGPIVSDDAPTEPALRAVTQGGPSAGASSRPAQRASSGRRPVATLVASLGALVVAGLLVVVGPTVLARGTPSASSPSHERSANGPSAPPASVRPDPSRSASSTALADLNPASLDDALTALRVAIVNARGGGGLKGAEAKELDKLVDEIERTYDAGDVDEVAAKAAALTEKIDKLDEKGEIEGTIAERLHVAAHELARLLRSD